MFRFSCCSTVVVLVTVMLLAVLPADVGAGEQAALSTSVVISPSDASFVYSRFADTNYGARTTLQIGSLDTMFPPPMSRAYIQFDLSGLPTGSTILSARVYLKSDPVPTGGSPMMQSVSAYYQASDAWSEGAITWNNAPGFSGTARGTQYILAGDTWYSWGVAPDVRDALADDQVYSVVIKQTTEDAGWIKFYSNDAASSSDYPYLEVVYNNCPPPPDPPPVPPFTLYIHDTGGVSPGWGQTYDPEFFEPMDGDSTTFARPSFGQDLDLNEPFYAVSGQVTGDYSANYTANIWFANNYAGHLNHVTVELRYGNCDDDGILLAVDDAFVINAPPAQKHTFNFGNISGLNLNAEALILKIIYDGPEEWDCHVYWDHSAKPSALVASPPPADTVVCEGTGGGNPQHPPTYWYDVTPGNFGRCDFHVRVYDTDPSNYSNPSLPGPTWQFQVHPVGDEWWASWWDSGCTNAIFSTFRFQFDHFDNTQWSVWGDWTTTIGGSWDPYYMVVDSSGAHTGEPDGYGCRVHVPSEPATAIEDRSGNGPNYLNLSQNIPNPFNPWTQIAYTIPDAAGDVHVTLNIYDVAGRAVKTLVDAIQPSGTYTARWDGTDVRGSGVASGIYFCRLHWNGDSRMIRMVLLR